MKLTATLFLVLAALIGTVQAQTVHEFRAAPAFGIWMGDTRFEIDLDIGRSELIFPTDVSLAGGTLGWRAMQDGHAQWTADVRFATAVNDPSEPFTDKDWIKLDGGGLFQFSSTRSNVDISMTDLEIEVTRRLTSGQKAELAVVFGLGYQKIEQIALDLEGTQTDWTDSSLIFYQVAYDDVVLTYEVSYTMPFAGLASRFYMGQKMLMELRGVVSPIMYVKDVDDHVLRFFTSEADGNGFGFGGRLAFEYNARNELGTRPFVRLEGELERAKIDVSGRREYYRDNPDDDFLAGEGFPEERTITNMQYGARLYVGITF